MMFLWFTGGFTGAFLTCKPVNLFVYYLVQTSFQRAEIKCMSKVLHFQIKFTIFVNKKYLIWQHLF